MLSNNEMKDVNGSELLFFLLSCRMSLPKISHHKQNIKPFAYFTLNEIPIGWQLHCPSDYYEG